jgi:hypothetical protein
MSHGETGATYIRPRIKHDDISNVTLPLKVIGNKSSSRGTGMTTSNEDKRLIERGFMRRR